VAQVVLVRHAMPEVRPDVPAERWRLGDEGRAAARDLAGALPREPLTLTSDEPKAWQTAQELVTVCGGTLAVDARVAETRRPPLWDESFRELARQFVAGRQHPGWEPHEAVDDAPGFGSQLAFPDAWTVSVRGSDGALVADAAPVRVG
jgi:broad specificity phosphatase PhoE